MMVEIIKSYYDTVKNMELIPLGTQLDVPEERALQLIEAKVAKEIKGKGGKHEEHEEHEENPIKEPKGKRK